ncbi:protein-disulfide reductase DsbD domain-containing protein [Wolbachia endosymbiont of Folsomia candida]|uniref:protein-disulfide reductase DsbD domain-containing protein n=1 Tax=Wolbachia endosymbiont of Folsomia candida TaxID=169402 RepID=UPI000B194444|nr:protein-disulfide reductase DsbD domain-containing protein [Wolbachia endosymbiont of Folsomia candida]APR98050.1 hypothetical protein ASM33_01890 [Wolbachia endosymbiont of Folsomia candida]
MKIYIYSILFLIFSCVQLYADEEVVKFDLLIGEIDKANLTIKGAIKISIDPDWHIYYKDPGDFGLPTFISYRGNTSSIDIHWPAPSEHKDEVGKEIFVSNIYENVVLFPFKVSVLSNQEYIDLNFHIKYAICKDRCIAKKAEITTRQPLKNFFNAETNKLINEWYKK